MTIMNIPKTTGYTEIVKIVEAALDLDRDKAIKYINKFIIKFPESDLIYPFTHLLKWKKNPSGLGHGDIIHTSHPTNPSDANHHTCPECSWLCSCSDQPCRCCSDEHKTTTLPSDEEIYKQSKISCKGNSHAMRYLPMLNQFRQGAKWMRSICQAKLAEVEMELQEAKNLVRSITEFADGMKVLDGEALEILKKTARRVLSDTPTKLPRK